VGWGEALERRDPGTWSHCQRTAAFAKVLAEALDLEEEEIRAIPCGALLHEIGKLEIPETILRKPAKLTAEEMLIMREYCLRGYEIVSKEASLQDAAEIVRSHRERFDGTGYPQGLKGEAIPVGARIVAVAETFEMLVRESPPPWGARNHGRGSGDPTLVRPDVRPPDRRRALERTG